MLSLPFVQDARLAMPSSPRTRSRPADDAAAAVEPFAASLSKAETKARPDADPAPAAQATDSASTRPSDAPNRAETAAAAKDAETPQPPGASDTDAFDEPDGLDTSKSAEQIVVAAAPASEAAPGAPIAPPVTEADKAAAPADQKAASGASTSADSPAFGQVASSPTAASASPVGGQMVPAHEPSASPAAQPTATSSVGAATAKAATDAKSATPAAPASSGAAVSAAADAARKPNSVTGAAAGKPAPTTVAQVAPVQVVAPRDGETPNDAADGGGSDDAAQTEAFRSGKPAATSSPSAVAFTPEPAAHPAAPASALAVASVGPAPVDAGTSTSPAAPPAPLPDPAVDDVAQLNGARVTRGLQNAVQQGGGSMTLRLTPADLGTVRIQMQLVGATVSAQFHTETESARLMLNQQITQLRHALEGQGLSVDRLSVQTLPPSSGGAMQHHAQQQSQQQADQAPHDGRSRGFAGQDQQRGGRGDSFRQSDETFEQMFFNQVA